MSINTVFICVTLQKHESSFYLGRKGWSRIIEWNPQVKIIW